MPRKPSSSTATPARVDMRASIKTIATELLIKRGFHATSYRDIATRLDITTTNIHYHFGNKERLVEEVLHDYVVGTASRHQAIWLDEGLTLDQKLQAVLAYNQQRYKRFNRGKHGTKPWSLIGRLRLDADVLSETARASLADFTASVHRAISQAVEIALARNEIRADTPGADLALLLINLVNSSSVFTQDAGGFERLEAFFRAFARVILSAYAMPQPGQTATQPLRVP